MLPAHEKLVCYKAARLRAKCPAACCKKSSQQKKRMIIWNKSSKPELLTKDAKCRILFPEKSRGKRLFAELMVRYI